ncbi:MAG: heavy-metal-associated domain-containing protein [Deltaproteobacteria bacterium]|nr:heavy-metal-associated domain-containing protein [Deltaproteobacteria bacterium]
MGTAARIRGILTGVPGVTHVVADPKAHTATVTFDDTKADVEKMKKALWEDDFIVEGEPKFIK